MNKWGVVAKVREKLASNQELLAQFNWLLQVWNTNRDHCYPSLEEGYEDEDECSHPNAVLSDPDEPVTYHCPDCGENFIATDEGDEKA